MVELQANHALTNLTKQGTLWEPVGNAQQRSTKIHFFNKVTRAGHTSLLGLLGVVITQYIGIYRNSNGIATITTAQLQVPFASRGR